MSSSRHDVLVGELERARLRAVLGSTLKVRRAATLSVTRLERQLNQLGPNTSESTPPK